MYYLNRGQNESYIAEQLAFGYEKDYSLKINAEIDDMFLALEEEDVTFHVNNDSVLNYGVSTLEKDTKYFRRQERLQDLEAMMLLVDSLKLVSIDAKKDEEIVLLVSVLKNFYNSFVNYPKDTGVLIINSKYKNRVISKVKRLYLLDEYNTEIIKLKNILKSL